MSKKKERPLVTLEQWVEVRIRDEKTETTLYPPTEELLKRLKKMETEPDLVYRRFHFVNGVPKEYYWATRDERRRQYGGAAIQRMSVETWRRAIAEEAMAGGGHLGPCGDPLPRPKERGGCECEVCVGNQRRLEGRGKK